MAIGAPACLVADLDSDGDVDGGDVVVCQACFTGPGATGAAGCAPWTGLSARSSEVRESVMVRD